MSSKLSEILDYAVRIGVQAKLENLSKAQIENLLSSLDFLNDPRLSLLVTSAFAHRQAARFNRGWNTARFVNELMNNIYRSEGDKEKARLALGLAKWIYEIMEHYKIPRVDVSKLTFEQFLEFLRGER